MLLDFLQFNAKLSKLYNEQMSYIQRFKQAYDNEKFFKGLGRKASFVKEVGQIRVNAQNQLCLLRQSLTTIDQDKVEKFENHTYKQLGNPNYRNKDAENELLNTLISYRDNFLPLLSILN